MVYEYPKYERSQNNVPGILGGMLIGALVGAVAMLFLAPRSGKDTRTQIQKKGIEPRDRTTKMVEDRVAQVSSKLGKITMDVKNYDRLENVSDTA